jgi:hypothetical protein
MQFSNYPAGVTDAHQHFNPQEVDLDLKCEAEEMELVPSYWVKAKLLEIRGRLDRWTHEEIKQALTDVLDTVYELEDNGTYDCPFHGPFTLPVSEEAEWDCEICGTTHKVDTVPEAVDPDAGWDGRHE